VSHHIEFMPLGALAPAKRNPKKHLDADIQKSVARFGYVEPIVYDERTSALVAGHGRREALLAMKAAGQTAPSGVKVDGEEWLVPVLRGWASRSDQEAEAYLLASNQLTIGGGWDGGPLADILRELEANDALDGVGFSSEDLDALLQETATADDPNDEQDVAAPPSDTYVQLGDVYALGRHRIICGDCTDPLVIDRLMGDGKASMSWTDPPYGVSYVGKTKDALTIENDGADGLEALLHGAFHSMDRVLEPGSPIYVAHPPGPLSVTFGNCFLQAGWQLRQTLVWDKGSIVLGHSDYHYRHEPILYGYKRAESGRRGRGGEGWYGDNAQASVLEFPKPSRSEAHPTMKPVELVEKCLLNSSERAAVVFEPFSGSGTTLLACEKTARTCRAVELDPKFVQVAIERWEALTGRKAVRLDDGATDEV
jgi:DNA modification methylase